MCRAIANGPAMVAPHSAAPARMGGGHNAKYWVQKKNGHAIGCADAKILAALVCYDNIGAGGSAGCDYLSFSQNMNMVAVHLPENKKPLQRNPQLISACSQCCAAVPIRGRPGSAQKAVIYIISVQYVRSENREKEF